MSSQFGKGAKRDSYDIRDFHYSAPKASIFDWNKGFDIEQKIGSKLVTKDQNGSFSCGGQAWAYLGEVLEAIATGNYEPRSARWIYSFTNYVPGGGSEGRTNSDHVIKKGWAREDVVTSYENGKPPSEAFMITKPKITNAVIEDTEVNKALSYLQVKPDIDLFAQAIQQNNGLVLGIDGQDNGTWNSAFPQPPVQKVWAHWLFAGKAKLINGKKYIGVKNSWGNSVGEEGWQWLGEEWFNAKCIWYGWTLAWDYTPAKRKLILIQLVKAYQSLVSLLVSQKNKVASYWRS